MSKCPCGSSNSYEHCCRPFHKGKALPATPEQLMRSRYSAFTKGDVHYLKQTMRGKALEGFNAKETKAWSQSVEWLGLTIVKAPAAQKDIGWVEFIARYKESGNEYKIHELSQFQNVDGKWYYVEGRHF